jgi:hypothetical protein
LQLPKKNRQMAAELMEDLREQAFSGWFWKERLRGSMSHKEDMLCMELALWPLFALVEKARLSPSNCSLCSLTVCLAVLDLERDALPFVQLAQGLCQDVH